MISIKKNDIRNSIHTNIVMMQWGIHTLNYSVWSEVEGKGGLLICEHIL